MTRTTKQYPIASFKALPNEGEGSFEAIVSVIGNVDLQGDRVCAGAFEKSIEKWKNSGDVLPVLWSHEWADPFAHIGYVNPADMHEIAPGKAGPLKGGLLVKGHLDVDKPFAKQVYDLLAARRVTEFSFAYDIPPGGERRSEKDGANELIELDLIEVGPTLKGANTETALLGVKSRLDRAARQEHAGLAPEVSSMTVTTLSTNTFSSGRKWDGNAAMHKCSSAADFRKIAFERANDSDPDTAAHWALPHHASPGGPADPAGVAAALAALHGGRGGAPDLKDASAAEAHLNGHSNSEKSREKAGRVIGAKAATALKQRILDAVDEFVNEINSGGEEPTSGEKELDPLVAELNHKLEELVN